MPESEPLGLPVLDANPDVDTGWSIYVLSSDDMSTVIDVIRNFREFGFNLPQDDIGVGTVTFDHVDYQSTYHDLLTNQTFWSFRQGGAERFRMLYEARDEDLSSVDEGDAGKIIVKGRNIGCRLAGAVVLPYNYPTVKKSQSRVFENKTWAHVWKKFFAESVARGELDTPGGVTTVHANTFDEDKDSFGVPWAVTTDFNVQIGGNLLSLLQDWGDEFGFGWQIDRRGYLYVSQNGYVGTDLSTTVRFLEGSGLVEREQQVDRSAVRTVVYVEDSEGDITGVTAGDAALAKYGGRRATYITNGDIKGTTTRQKYADSQLKMLSRQAQTTVVSIPARPVHPVTNEDIPRRALFDFRTGDMIGVGPKSGTTNDFRVIDIAVGVDNAGQETVELTLEGKIQQLLRKLARSVFGRGTDGSNGSNGSGGGGGSGYSTIRFFDDNFDVVNPRSEFALTYLPLAYSEHVTVSIDGSTATRKLRRGQEWTRSGSTVTVLNPNDVFTHEGPWWFEVQYAYDYTNAGGIPEPEFPPDAGGGDPVPGGTYTTVEEMTLVPGNNQTSGGGYEFGSVQLNGGNLATTALFSETALGCLFSLAVTFGAELNASYSGDCPVWNTANNRWREARTTLPNLDPGFYHDATVLVLGLATEEEVDAVWQRVYQMIKSDTLIPENLPQDVSLTIQEDKWEVIMDNNGGGTYGSNTWVFPDAALDAVHAGSFIGDGDLTGLGSMFAVRKDDTSGQVVYNQGNLNGDIDFGTYTPQYLGPTPSGGSSSEWIDITEQVQAGFANWNGFFFNLTFLTMPEFQAGAGGNSDYAMIANKPSFTLRRTVVWSVSELDDGGGDGGDGGDGGTEAQEYEWELFDIRTDAGTDPYTPGTLDDANDGTTFTPIANASVDPLWNISDVAGKLLITAVYDLETTPDPDDLWVDFTVRLSVPDADFDIDEELAGYPFVYGLDYESNTGYQNFSGLAQDAGFHNYTFTHTRVIPNSSAPNRVGFSIWVDDFNGANMDWVLSELTDVTFYSEGTGGGGGT